MNFSITPSRACGSEISELNAEVGTAKDAFITAAVRTLPARRKQGFDLAVQIVDQVRKTGRVTIGDMIRLTGASRNTLKEIRPSNLLAYLTRERQ